MFKTATKPLRILDFDLENRPLHYWFGDATTAEVTAIAWAWYGDESRKGRPNVHVKLLKAPPKQRSSAIKMFKAFSEAYEEADIVTGHFIRGHDLPMINGQLAELGLPGLGPKLTSDTKLDLMKRKAMSVSQKNLAGMLGVEAPKVDMPQTSWRDANRLTPDGIKLTEARVVGDILQHMQLRQVLINRGLLGEPKLWVPGGGGGLPEYTP